MAYVDKFLATRKTRRRHRKLDSTKFCFDMHELVLLGREDAYGVCASKSTRPFGIDLSQLVRTLPWQKLFGLIVADLGN